MKLDRVSEWFEENWEWMALIVGSILLWGLIYKYAPRHKDPIVKAKSSVSREYDVMKELIADWEEVCIKNETDSITLPLRSIRELEHLLTNYGKAVTVLDSLRREQINQLDVAYRSLLSTTDERSYYPHY